MTFLMGACGGGVWKTEDGGSTWSNISDGYFGGSIGAVTVCPSNPNIIYVGGGEVSVRGNVSHGNGVWKSTDGGKTWKHMGLEDSRRIPRIRVHPTNPDIVYVAAMGHLFGPNEQRGVFRSTDGGKNWKRVLFANDEAGAVDLQLDPNNPDILFASTWKIKRTPYSLESGGEGSGLWRSDDGGETWKNITRHPGLPKSMVGIIGVAISPVDSNRIWAIIEASDGGVFRSDDGGATWSRINQERTLRQRAWYYTRIYAGTKSRDEVYVLNVRFWRSNDGGKTYQSISTPHGDHHDLWIDPDEPDRMVIADDGGAQVTYNRGKTWSTYMNQPTAQFYRVTTDTHFPYRIYGAQQDNSTVRINHRSSSFRIGERDWEPTAGGESGHIAPDPNNPEIVYGGSYGGYLTRFDHQTKNIRNIHVWPDNPMGHGAGDSKYRFQWNFPIFFSPNDSKTLYTAANVLFKTTNGGQNWTRISGDLTRNDPSKLGPSGGPITKDNTGVEYYCTIFAAAESHHQAGVIWAGSDDGLVHVTRNGGKKWVNVTPPDLPEWAQINSLEIHPTKPGSIYLAATRYKLDDFKPYLYKTTDFGKSWKKIDSGIDRKHFTRVVRADPNCEGLLYAGTENGLYVSFDDGESWKPMQANLPIVPITDLAVKDDDLIVATQGRSFWVLDDLTILHQWNEDVRDRAVHLFHSRPAIRMRGGSTSRPSLTAGQNAPSQVAFRVLMKEAPGKRPVKLVVRDRRGNVIRRWEGKSEKQDGDKKRDEAIGKLELKPGINVVTWNMRYPSAKRFDGMILWGGGTSGPRAVPGLYKAALTVGDETQTIEFRIEKDPRVDASLSDLRAQFEFHISVRDKLSETHLAIKRLRDIRGQIQSVQKRMKGRKKYESLFKQAQEIIDALTEVETTLYQTKAQSPQDPLNFPIRLNNRLSALVSVVDTGDYPPTHQSIQVRDEITKLIDVQLKRLKTIIGRDVAAFNRAVRKQKVPAIFVDPAP